MPRLSWNSFLLLAGSLSALSLGSAHGNTESAVAQDGTANPATQPIGNECLKTGDAVGVFYVTKVAGADDDGVKPGEDLCYRCRYGSSPMVMVFARRIGGRVPELVKRIDAAVSTHKESRLKGLITLMGENSSELRDAAGHVAEEAAVRNVPVTVAKEFKTGPLNYKLPSDAAVTVVVAKDSQVVNTHTFSADKIDIAAVMHEVQQIVN